MAIACAYSCKQLLLLASLHSVNYYHHRFSRDRITGIGRKLSVILHKKKQKYKTDIKKICEF